MENAKEETWEKENPFGTEMKFSFQFGKSVNQNWDFSHSFNLLLEIQLVFLIVIHFN